MGTAEFERFLGRQCAPTFRAIKAANLVAFPRYLCGDVTAHLARYAPCLARHGIAIRRLAKGERRTLALFYRPAVLRRLLASPEARQLLAKYGYPPEGSLLAMLAHLERRIGSCDSFPHEIGLFLGYPPGDVRGFIEHRGRDFACCGYWKVYGDAAAARAVFGRYAACTEAFCQKLAAGVPMASLLAAGRGDGKRRRRGGEEGRGRGIAARRKRGGRVFRQGL